MRSPAIKRFITLLAVVIVIYILPTGFSSALRDATVRLVRPIGHSFLVKNAGLYNTYNNFKQIGSLRESNTRLQKQVLDLQQQLADSESIKRENAVLQKEAGVTGVTREAKKVLGRIVFTDSDPLDRNLTIDIGSDQGVAVGQAAVSQGALVGTVISAEKHSSVIRTLTSQRSKVQVWLISSREKGLLQGTGTSVELTDITQGVNVPQGSVIETSGLGGSLPQGILVGSTNGTLSKQSELSQTFSMELSQDPQSLESIFIMVNQ